MEIVTLKVQVDNSQLTKLQTDVNGLQGKKITLDTKPATAGLKDFSTAAQTATKSTESLLNSAAKFTKWYLIGNAVAGAARSLKAAVATLKEVDSALVTVQKTTGYTKEQISELTDTRSGRYQSHEKGRDGD